MALTYAANALCESIGRRSVPLSVSFRHLGKASGLTQISVMAIYQDRIGQMWFGTEEGLNIYDGVLIKPLTQVSSPDKSGLQIGNETYNIVGDSKGNVFFDADNALFRYELRTQRYSRLIENNVNALYADGGRVYVGVNDTVYTIDENTLEKRVFCLLKNKSHRAIAFRADSRGRVWIGTNSGLYTVSAKGGAPKCVIPACTIWTLYEDSRHNLWASTRNSGLFMIDKDGRQRHFVAQADGSGIASDQTRGIVEDDFGNLWIGTFLGLNRYDRSTGAFSLYAHSHLPNSLSHSSVFPLYRDQQGTLWAGTYYGGVDFFNPRKSIFAYYPPDPNGTRGLSYPYVSHMAEDSDGNLWIGTEGGGLNKLDRRTGRFTHYLMNSRGTSVAHNNVKDILFDKRNNRLLIATHTGGLSVFDLTARRFQNPHLQNERLHTLTGDRIMCMQLFGDTLIFTSEKGIWKMYMPTRRTELLFKPDVFYGNSYFLIDRKRRMWVANSSGIWRISIDNNGGEKRYYAYGTHGLGHFPIICMTQSRSGILYFGTRGSGVCRYDETEDSFTGYTARRNGLAGDYCYAIKETPKGSLLISGDKGLTLLNPWNGSCQTVGFGAALPLSGFNTGCGIYVCKDGEMFVGGTDGMVSFREKDLTQHPSQYGIYWNELQVNNKTVLPMDSTAILKLSVTYTGEIELSHDENDIILGFATNNYIPTLNSPVYEYCLEGMDKRWTQTRERKIHYTNIGAGRYTLVLRERDNHTHTIRMVITVRPPLWATPWAYILYIVIAVMIAYGLFRFKQQQLKLKFSLDMERRDKESIQQLNQAKLQFFTNISHEFRTPLTLIQSHLDALSQTNGILPTVKNRLGKIRQNTIYLRKLISELLDFRKLEQGYVRLKVRETDIVPYLRDIFATFKDLADRRKYTYTFTPLQETLPCLFDPEQMEKVVNNLLSNAFKYTKNEIGLSVGAEDGKVCIRVTDNGAGLAPEEAAHVFERFYQVTGKDDNNTHNPGTGIGLAVVKRIMDLHHGTAKVDSMPGYGSVFTVMLPNDASAYTEEERAAATAYHVSNIAKYASSDSAEQTDETPHTDTGNPSYTVLLAEDNEELLLVLAELFAPAYRVVTACDGQEALEKIRKEPPDLVVSDIMMPRMSGSDMCLAVKSDPTLCHIPIVLLTALGSTEQHISGLKIGADDYISKPFDAEVLLARCNSLLRNRYRLQKRLRQDNAADKGPQLANNAADRQLLGSVNAIIERKIDDSDFTVDDIACELAMSRTRFYAKFKQITGMSPNDYILNCKLKRAAEWLCGSPELPIKEITYRLGFNSPRYFSNCFKKQFGVSPAEYRKKAEAGT